MEKVMSHPAAARRASHVIERLVDGELVLYDPERQYVHALNPTASFIWRACDGRQDEGAIATALATLYPDCRKAIQEDVRSTLRLFLEEGLVQE